MVRREIDDHDNYYEGEGDDICDEGDEGNGGDEGDEDDASVWRQKWGSQLASEVSAERMSGFRET